MLEMSSLLRLTSMGHVWQANPSGLVPRSVIDVMVFDLALDRSCGASIITRRSWYGIVITSTVLKRHGVSVDSRIAIAPTTFKDRSYHLS